MRLTSRRFSRELSLVADMYEELAGASSAASQVALARPRAERFAPAIREQLPGVVELVGDRPHQVASRQIHCVLLELQLVAAAELLAARIGNSVAATPRPVQSSVTAIRLRYDLARRPGARTVLCFGRGVVANVATAASRERLRPSHRPN